MDEDEDDSHVSASAKLPTTAPVESSSPSAKSKGKARALSPLDSTQESGHESRSFTSEDEAMDVDSEEIRKGRLEGSGQSKPLNVFSQSLLQPKRVDHGDSLTSTEPRKIMGISPPRLQSPPTLANKTTGSSGDDDLESWTRVTRMADHIMFKAIINGQSLPRIHSGTRRSILEELGDWLPEEGDKGLLWLNGAAGVGKSTILRTIANDGGPKNVVTLFISSEDQCDDSAKLIPTIAFQFFRVSESYKQYILEKVKGDRHIAQMTMEQQFHFFISKPIGGLRIFDEESHWILIDGLDLCRGRSEAIQSPTSESMSKDAQSLIISLIARFVLDYPTAPLRWIISSRAEAHIKAIFTHPAVQPSCWRLSIPINDDEACSDVRVYLKDGFHAIQQSMHLTHEWPTAAEIEKVAKFASGLFRIAKDILDFVQRSSEPIAQLETILSIIDGSFLPPGSQSPFLSLDASYSQIMSRIPTDVYQDTYSIIGHLMLREQFMSNSLFLRHSLCSTANILGIDQHRTYRALNGLHSVLYVPRPEVAHKENIRFLHTSFPLYLRDRKRSGIHGIDLLEVNTDIWRCYSRILRQLSQNDLQDGQESQSAFTLSWPLKGSEYEIQKWTSGIEYEAKFHWAHFLIPDCPCNMPSRFGPVVAVSLSEEERLDAVCSINFSNLIDGYFPKNSDHIAPFSTFVSHLWEVYEEKLTKCGLNTKVLSQLSSKGSPSTTILRPERNLSYRPSSSFSAPASTGASPLIGRLRIFPDRAASRDAEGQSLSSIVFPRAPIRSDRLETLARLATSEPLSVIGSHQMPSRPRPHLDADIPIKTEESDSGFSWPEFRRYPQQISSDGQRTPSQSRNTSPISIYSEKGERFSISPSYSRKRSRSPGKRDGSQVPVSLFESSSIRKSAGASAAHLAASERKRKREKRFSCDVCGDSFTTKQNLQNHMNSHLGLNPYLCPICQKSYRHSRSLNRHMTKEHNGLRGDSSGGQASSSMSSNLPVS